ncbi:hypothetical protein BBP40_008530 [Aspergillus hancockii]|nr:hypothetical protein BBP40_008530 [Aspergillus hancockii]
MEIQDIEWTRLASRIAMSLATIFVTSFFYKMVKVRLLFYLLKEQGMPMPPWHPIFSNIRVLATLAKRVPKDAYKQSPLQSSAPSLLN